jgi:hypothetical protein
MEPRGGGRWRGSATQGRTETSASAARLPPGPRNGSRLVFVRGVLTPGPGIQSKATFKLRLFQSALRVSSIFLCFHPPALPEVMIPLSCFGSKCISRFVHLPSHASGVTVVPHPSVF